MNTESKLPLSRDEDLVIQEFPDETLVYDLANHKAHCLNKTATAVWRRCDGKTTVREMASLLHEQESLPADESIVWLALKQLEKRDFSDRPAANFAIPHAGRRGRVQARRRSRRRGARGSGDHVDRRADARARRYVPPERQPLYGEQFRKVLLAALQ